MKTLNEQTKELKDRVLSDTPTHFVRFGNFGVIIAGAGIVVKIAAAIFPATMPIGLVSLAPELIAIGLTITGVSQTAKKDSNNIGEKGGKTIISKVIDLFRK